MCSDDGDEDEVGDENDYFMTGAAPTHTHACQQSQHIVRMYHSFHGQ